MNKFNLWELQFSEPHEESGRRPSYANVRRWVASETMERAVELIRAEHPSAEFHQVIRRNNSYSGPHPIIIAPELSGGGHE